MTTDIQKFRGISFHDFSVEQFEGMQRFAKAAVMSRLCNVKNSDPNEAVAEVFIQLQMGAEFGLSPMQSIRSVNVVKGKPELSAVTQGALIRGSRKYDYEVLEHTDEVCRIRFISRDGATGTETELGVSSFGIDDARKADLLGQPNWRKYPRNMLFCRAMSNGAKWYVADVFGGEVYHEGELSGGVEVTALPGGPSRLEEKIDDGIIDGEVEGMPT